MNERTLIDVYFLDEMIADENCPLPPMDGYPECKKKVEVRQSLPAFQPRYS